MRDDVLEEVGPEKFPNAGNLHALRSDGLKEWNIFGDTDKEWYRASQLLEEGEGIQKKKKVELWINEIYLHNVISFI